MIKIVDVMILEREAMYIHCPKCKSVATVEIAYGKPSHEMMEAHKYGLIHLAGCVIDDDGINRHCIACGCDFISNEVGLPGAHQKQSITVQEMNRMLDTLEQNLKAVHQNIEREYMRLGRDCKAEVSYAVFEYLREHHSAWDLFLDRLQYCGDPTVIVGHEGKIMARYSNNTARLYLVKNHYQFYSLLVELAQACHWLGRTSRCDQNDIDDLKDASIAVQNARENIDKNWKSIRTDAISLFD
ncbi:hypothetical protein [Limnohabitans parvus]|uniref:Uncharacterized protein n=1 Tax=Limnohabitans parvus II-B4 TaxID=1293052 RepID=A0A315FQX6_9BURK|nr:hypothetical protein [Limnohabitans parvus]PUE55707.1 hypothetical protein B9Z37_03970 [Limnohabitans parvus II-B4]